MIGSIGGTAATPQITGAGRPQRPDMAKAMEPVAQLLGTDVESLRAQMKGGTTTLSEIAEKQGVSRDDLLNAITEGMEAAHPSGAPEPPDGFAAMAANIADGKRPQGPPPGQRSGGSEGGESRISSLAKLLGVDEDTLLEQLKSGLSDVGSLLGKSDQTWSLQQGLTVDTKA
ncbi:MAG: hypothetical protein JHC95_21760 [Solirubrobacteraceae bacterium]|nr:hypothetical protein [Solirubrobacteraceae bacterium]